MDEQASPGVFFNSGGGGTGRPPQAAAEAARAHYNVPGILRFLRHEWACFEVERAQWEVERAELQVGSRARCSCSRASTTCSSWNECPVPSSGYLVV